MSTSGSVCPLGVLGYLIVEGTYHVIHVSSPLPVSEQGDLEDGLLDTTPSDPVPLGGGVGTRLRRPVSSDWKRPDVGRGTSCVPSRGTV